jgi:mannose PTS system EIIA component
MTIATFIIAHAPLASALRQCVLHVFPAVGSEIVALDVQADVSPEATQAAARALMATLGAPQVLLFTDVFGATPCNIAQKLVDGVNSRLIAGVNLPMLLRAMTYRDEPMDLLVARALAGGSQGVMQVASAAPQNQTKRTNDQDQHDHSQ